MKKPKYQQLADSLKDDILSARYRPGDKLPSENALVQRRGLSRITVTRALRELQTAGLIQRVAGSGSYVTDRGGDARPLSFGLLIPDLGETEVFEPICRGMINAPEATRHVLIWGHADPEAPKSAQALGLCRQFLSRQVAGVFFAPLEFERDADQVNRRILAAFKRAAIPVVLLDRRPGRLPDPQRADLVGLNNYQAGYTATEHLILLGCRRIGFVSYHGSPVTIAERRSGYKDALRAHGLRPVDQPRMLEDSRALARRRAVEAMVCVNDRVAGQLMHLFLRGNIRVPQDIRLVGIDDVPYASLLPVPLTTVRQPTREIGETALRLMLDRIRSPRQAPREILLDGTLVVRESSGPALLPSKTAGPRS